MIIEHLGICECGCERGSHNYGFAECRACGCCQKFVTKRSEVPDIFEEDDDEQSD